MGTLAQRTILRLMSASMRMGKSLFIVGGCEKTLESRFAVDGPAPLFHDLRRRDSPKQLLVKPPPPLPPPASSPRWRGKLRMSSGEENALCPYLCQTPRFLAVGNCAWNVRHKAVTDGDSHSFGGYRRRKKSTNTGISPESAHSKPSLQAGGHSREDEARVTGSEHARIPSAHPENSQDGSDNRPISQPLGGRESARSAPGASDLGDAVLTPILKRCPDPPQSALEAPAVRCRAATERAGADPVETGRTVRAGGQERHGWPERSGRSASGGSAPSREASWDTRGGATSLQSRRKHGTYCTLAPRPPRPNS